MADREQFAAFVRARGAALQRSAWLLTGDWTLAEDLVQSSLARTWTRWPHLEAPEAALVYTRKVRMTTFLGWRRRRWVGEVALGWLPDRAEAGPVTDAVDERTDLVAAVLRLPRRQRAVVVLRYFDDQTEAATAAALGCSVGTVKSHCARALATLRTLPELAPDAEEHA